MSSEAHRTQDVSPYSYYALGLLFVVYVVNFMDRIGLGAGPQAVGILSDLFAPRFGSHSLRYALLIVCVFNLFAAASYLLAARSVREDIASRDQEG